ncbi:MAG: PorT family protein [Cyclobacteriaceae bacterium]|nr:PorT family protein [Cyclobacteriaceae bacterium]
MRNKPLFLILLLIGISHSINAQFSLGVKTGISQNIVRQTPENEWSPSKGFHPGFHAGAYCLIPMTKKFAISPEFQFIKKGYEEYRNFNYLELPVLLDYSAFRKIHLQAGAAIAGEISVTKVSGLSLRFSDGYCDLSFIGGLQFVASKKLSILARYNQSLRPVRELVFNSGPPDVSTQESYQTYLKSIQLAIQYKLKGKSA